MNFEMVGKNGLTITKSMEEFAYEKTQRITEYFKPEVKLDVRILCKSYKEDFKVEVTAVLKSLTLRAEVKDDDMYAAITQGVEKIIAQIKKHNSQIKNRLSKDGLGEVFSDELDVKGLQTEILAQNIVKNKNITLEPMTSEEAISQMELVGHDFFVFLNKDTKQVSVVYLRDDFDYAVIDTKL